MARLQVAGRLRQVPEVVDFERAATFTKPEKRGLERRRLNIMERAPIRLRRGNSCRSGRLRWRLQFRFFDDVELSPPPAEGTGNLKPRLRARATNFRFVNSVTQANHFFVKTCAIIFCQNIVGCVRTAQAERITLHVFQVQVMDDAKRPRVRFTWKKRVGYK